MWVAESTLAGSWLRTHSLGCGRAEENGKVQSEISERIGDASEFCPLTKSLL
jgi:hypothetical protein